ncbi:hypothetical protein AAIH73_34870, partial [Pseudomonas aeruginosa]|uniref:hypothetical protein n=1 Tax=Pseudomonas aeruginosa TaxID=287 RepID=UPI0031B7249B
VVAPLSLLENWEDELGKTFASIPFRDVVVLQSGRSLRDYRVKGAERESVQLASMIDDSSGMMDEQSIRYALHVGPGYVGDRRTVEQDNWNSRVP